MFRRLSDLEEGELIFLGGIFLIMGFAAVTYAWTGISVKGYGWMTLLPGLLLLGCSVLISVVLVRRSSKT